MNDFLDITELLVWFQQEPSGDQNRKFDSFIRGETDGVARGEVVEGGVVLKGHAGEYRLTFPFDEDDLDNVIEEFI